MIGKLLLAFVLLPLLDLYLLLELAERIGALETIGIVILTGIVGGFLARTQGTQTIRRIQYRLQNGESPSREMADGALILVGAALLVTPGLLTDGIGFLLLLPVTRPLVRRLVISYLKKKAKSERVVVEANFENPQE